MRRKQHSTKKDGTTRKEVEVPPLTSQLVVRGPTHWVQGGVGSGWGVSVPRPEKLGESCGHGLKEDEGGVRAFRVLMVCRALPERGLELSATETRMWMECKLTDEMKANTTDKW